jgi:hypothetical protein
VLRPVPEVFKNCIILESPCTVVTNIFLKYCYRRTNKFFEKHIKASPPRVKTFLLNLSFVLLIKKYKSMMQKVKEN